MVDFCDIVLGAIVQSIKANPLRPAFNIGGRVYSYRQFGTRISAIRRAVKQVVRDDRVIALSLHDDIDTYASIVALWMEGLVYVPLHPNQPLERNLSIIDQVGTHYVIDTDGASIYADWGHIPGHRVIEAAGLECEDIAVGEWTETDDKELAYILFTSGSTGVPKGVMISRKNVAAFMDSFWRTGISIDEKDRCLQAFDLTFDVSVQSFLVALTKGACVYTVPYGSIKYLYVASLLQEEGITFGAMAPSMLTYLRPYFDELDASSLKACILTAEACPADLMEAWYKCAEKTEIYDFYGPTEATIYCTYYKLSRLGGNLSENGIISIGKPLANVDAIILAEDGTIVKGTEKGELCVSGDQVTSGYWNNPEKNETAFFELDVDGVTKRFYHTGDLCYWHESGNLLYCGRMDQQVKIQGFRVELGEIEYHAREYYRKENRTVAMAFQNEKSLTEIALFVEREEEEPAGLLDYLRSKLPGYMVPSRIVYRPVFPLNDSDKIDRNTLKIELASSGKNG